MHLIKNYMSVIDLLVEQKLLDEDTVGHEENLGFWRKAGLHPDLISYFGPQRAFNLLAHSHGKAGSCQTSGLADSNHSIGMSWQDKLRELRGLTTAGAAAHNEDSAPFNAPQYVLAMLQNGEISLKHNWLIALLLEISCL